MVDTRSRGRGDVVTQTPGGAKGEWKEGWGEGGAGRGHQGSPDSRAGRGAGAPGGTGPYRRAAAPPRFAPDKCFPLLHHSYCSHFLEPWRVAPRGAGGAGGAGGQGGLQPAGSRFTAKSAIRVDVTGTGWRILS